MSARAGLTSEAKALPTVRKARSNPLRGTWPSYALDALYRRCEDAVKAARGAIPATAEGPKRAASEEGPATALARSRAAIVQVQRRLGDGEVGDGCISCSRSRGQSRGPESITARPPGLAFGYDMSL